MKNDDRPKKKDTLWERINYVIEFKRKCAIWDEISHFIGSRPTIRIQLIELLKPFKANLNEMEQEILSWKWPL